MTWTLQLTPWALPPILAILLVLRDGSFLWPRRREGGTHALLALCAGTFAWAALDVVSAVSHAPEVKYLAARIEHLPESVAVVAWAWFAVSFVKRSHELLRWPMVALYGSFVVLAALALDGRSSLILIREWHAAPMGSLEGLQVRHGYAHWVFLAIRSAAVLTAGWTISRHLGRSRAPARAPIPMVASLLAVPSPFLPLLFEPGAEWVDLSSTGFAVAGAVLVWGLVRPEMDNLGPVDREVVLRELRDPIVVMDGRGRIVDVNGAARRELGLRPYGDVPLSLGTVWATGPAPEGTPLPRVVLGETGEDPRVFEVTLTPLGDTRRSALLLRDVTAAEIADRRLRQMNSELDRLARTDPLTGLANRRHFMEALEKEVDRSRRYDRPLSVILLDLDHFKNVNDTHGHAAGDDVLRGASQALRSVCRDVDLAARLGGEELAVLLPETDAFGARAVAERVRERIGAQVHVAPSGRTFGVTASMGVASVGEKTLTGEALLQASDAALYQAKDGGRNRTVVAGRGPPRPSGAT